MQVVTEGTLDLDREACYRALRTRDRRFDGRFFIAVTTTGIFCRPICPARPAKMENCIFVPSAAAAHRMGYRPCLRCRPEAAPGVAAWRGAATTVSRALQIMADNPQTDQGLEDLATRLGVGTRHLRRLFDRYVGASPISVLQTQRLLFAKKLLGETSLSMTDIAFAAGFGSIRRFNDAFKKTYRRAPSTLRSRGHIDATSDVGITLKLPFTEPYDWPAMIDFLRAHAMPGVESVEGDRFSRTFSLDGAHGLVQVQPIAGESQLLATIQITDIKALGAVVARVRRVFDLDADINAIDEHLAQDPLMAAKIRARPGIRVPGAWDNFELAIRALLATQTAAKARTTMGRLASTFGRRLRAAGDASPGWLFPEPKALARADLSRVGLTGAVSKVVRELSQAMADDEHLLRAYETLDDTIGKLGALPGIERWTAQYIAMRALREPDAFPATDPALLRAVASGQRRRPSPAHLTTIAEAWRPWRAYAAMRLWMQAA
jgi:AraC family transcriptional regulator, regulatory protein of adaptative response / DNA-3-methyladenine glycosylase II